MNYEITVTQSWPGYCRESVKPVGEASNYADAERLVGLHACNYFPSFTGGLHWRDPITDSGTYEYEGRVPAEDGTVTYQINPATSVAIPALVA